jgi:hypothetical protein
MGMACILSVLNLYFVNYSDGFSKKTGAKSVSPLIWAFGTSAWLGRNASVEHGFDVCLEARRAEDLIQKKSGKISAKAKEIGNG